ncbi:hypothetical protein SAMD00019534_101280 [Acytostelium subglobosum LB1]|uniref:hypothetical protein n=1 Tax=Acytostelium subglobosum LB1 TaxID=1410327 RepID=UPI0006451E2F|nr:hypothetical protein SAMD00019534_101280 [Acytostelium subglobosum LB1]GAM26953.1 hypothetical protein SAMD00019534_101280 [Acytostelium subglobosum LB1]|eukprot:XP_012750221.1 hypothetical protein SAMD00019534_101280 [Acytostelium subglobosum LB1]
MTTLNVFGSFLRKVQESNSDVRVDKVQIDLFIQSVCTLETTSPASISYNISLVKYDYMYPLISQILANRQCVDQDVLYWIGQFVIIFESFDDDEMSLERTEKLLSQAIAKPDWCYFLLVDRQHLTTLVKNTDAEHMDHLYRLYIDLLRLYNDCPHCYENIAMAFGEERVSQELHQCLLSTPTSSPKLRYGWLNDATRSKAMARFLSSHTQEVFDYLDSTSFGTLLRSYSIELDVMILVLQDDKLMSSQRTMERLRRMADLDTINATTDGMDKLSLLLSPLLTPDNLSTISLGLDTLKSVRSLNTIIKLMGKSFPEHYQMFVEHIKRGNWSKDDNPLILLDAITQHYNQTTTIYMLQPLAYTIGGLILLDGNILKKWPTTKDTPTIIRSLIRLMEICNVDNDDYTSDTPPRNDHLFYLAMIYLIRMYDDMDQSEALSQDLVQRYPIMTKRFIDKHFRPFLGEIGHINVHFLSTCNEHSLFDHDEERTHELYRLVFMRFPDSKRVHRLINSYIKASDIWTQHVDNVMNESRSSSDEYSRTYQELRSHITKANILLFSGPIKYIHPASVLHFLKYLYNTKLYEQPDHFTASSLIDYKSIKQSLFNKFRHNDEAKYQSLRQQFIEMKSRSFVDRPPPLVVDPTLWHTLPPLIVRHIVDFLVMDGRSDRSTHSRWVLSLSTVSKQLHRATMMSISSNPVPSLGIIRTLNHIGSTYCLFQNAPLHLDINYIQYIPIQYLDNMLEYLESLTLPIDDEFMCQYDDNHFDYINDGDRKLMFVAISNPMPRLKHIEFVEESNLFYYDVIGNMMKDPTLRPWIKIDHLSSPLSIALVR